MFSANSSQVSDSKLFVEDVFSTYLYTGNGSTQTITNGIDLTGKGGLVWLKMRSPGSGWSATQSHALFDTVRGDDKYLSSDLSNGQYTFPNNGITFNSSGFGIDAASYFGGSGDQSTSNFASWTFREAPKFFDIVTYTGNGATTRDIAHSLGVAPGMVIVKATSTTDYWWCWHRAFAADEAIFLNTTGAKGTYANSFPSVPTATNFTVGSGGGNTNGVTYVAYLYAHDATSDGIIQCGSLSYASASGATTVDLGWEPQWLLIKRASETGAWIMVDNMRGWGNGGDDNYLMAQSSAAEALFNVGNPTATGFTFSNGGQDGTYIYVAIRRGPMRTPTLGTSVFAPILASSSDTAGKTFTTNFPIDMQATRLRIGDSTFFTDRLRGVSSTSAETGPSLRSNTTAAESTTSPAPIPRNWNNTGFQLSSSLAGFNMVNWNFRRAPGFFDEVCYTGTGATLTSGHNLGVVPELVITKSRSTGGQWAVNYSFGATTCREAYLSLTNAGTLYAYSAGTAVAALPTASQIQFYAFNAGDTYVSYLFASAPGVSKVGTYTGTGALQTINCGFAAGARFVLIKRTDSTGDWYVWDSARGISSGNDPYLLLNTTAGETTSTNYVDTDATGFKVTAAAPAALNASGGNYLFLAIA